jgi:hypothetical protein
MFRRFITTALLAVLIPFAAVPAGATTHQPSTIVAATGQMATFDTEASAQQHCPRDTVVWLNTKTGIFHEKGMRWYGRTRSGAFVCRTEAVAAGYRDTRNGQ